MRHVRLAGIAAVIGSLAVGCGGHGSANPLAEEARRITTSTPAPEPAAADTPVEVTSRGGIEGALATLIDRRIRCGRSPHDCDVDRIALPGTDVHDSLVDLMNDRIANHVVASTSGSLRYRIDGVSMIGADAASVRVCFTDDTVLVQAVPAADGMVVPPLVVDDSSFSAITDWELRWAENEWLWAAERPVNWAVGEDLCGV